MRYAKHIIASFCILHFAFCVSGCGESAPGPKVIAHRGAWDNEAAGGAKNSIAALRAAIDKGVWGTEFDVRVTADGVPVVFHDALTATGIEIELASFERLRSGAELLANGEAIPTLEEFFSAWDHAPVMLVLELKTDRDETLAARAVDIVLKTVRGAGVAPGEIEYISFRPDVVRGFATRGGGSLVAYLGGDLTPAQAHSELGATGIDYSMDMLRAHPEWIDEAHTLGMTVNVWTVASADDAAFFSSAGVDYITSDAP